MKVTYTPKECFDTQVRNIAIYCAFYQTDLEIKFKSWKYMTVVWRGTYDNCCKKKLPLYMIKSKFVNDLFKLVLSTYNLNTDIVIFTSFLSHLCFTAHAIVCILDNLPEGILFTVNMSRLR